jgi:hypothetical protein
VQAENVNGPDWRDAAAYAPLIDADRSLFAWEWLRRDPAYRAAAVRGRPTHSSIEGTVPGPESFGLLIFEPPQLAAPHARPVWSSDVYPSVLSVDRTETELNVTDEIDLRRMNELVRIVVGNDAEHLLLSDGVRAIRLDGPPSTFSAGPVRLRYSIEGLVAAEGPLLTLRRLLALCRTGQFSQSLHRREARARRWIMILRAHDALNAGADQRQIALELLSRSVVEPGWRSRESSVRSQAQRLVRSAGHIAAGGYRCLLR